MLENNPMMNEPQNVAEHFQETQDNYFFLSELLSFDPKAMEGTALAIRYRRKLRLSFNQEMLPFEKAQGWEFPDAYGNDKVIKFRLAFISPTCLRLVFDVSKLGNRLDADLSPMVLDGMPKAKAHICTLEKNDDEQIAFSSDRMKVTIQKKPFRVVVINSKGRQILNTVSIQDKEGIMNDNPIPFGFIQRTGTGDREIAFTSRISHDEKFFGCGESFTRLDKRGQSLNLSSCDPKGVCTRQMYKPVPFFHSSNGYGCFVATTRPLTLDFGHQYDGVQTMYVNDDRLDLFVFEGDPKSVLGEYTSITGRSPMPPEWSFGLWMGRITYSTQKEVEDVAAKLREYDIPCDVIHIDTGWFKDEWRCDFKFSKERFPDVKAMVDKLHSMGFHISLWQLPYFTPQNPLYREIIENGYNVRGLGSPTAGEDAILDMSNPDAVAWYQRKLSDLLEVGIDAIKADFGEAAPYNGIYANGESGTTEHNIFPVRYCKAVSEITRKTKGHGLVWARSAWAGSQRYPVHWGGDAENTNTAMASTLRAGLSLGLCGFTYWSHDLGGFVKSPYPDLYLRWLAFGMFTSHARCHGNPPKEPWEFGKAFMDEFRRVVKIRYAMMPYVLEQAKESSENGFPMIRTLFFEIPEDPQCWVIEDQYFFGSDLMVAPIFEDDAKKRNVYLPSGYRWRDYFSGKLYEGGSWRTIETDSYIVVLKREDAR